MTMLRTTRFALILATLPLIGACREEPAADAARDTTAAAQDGAAEAKTMIGKAVQEGIADARKELREGNLTISGGNNVHFRAGDTKVDVGNDSDGRPHAEITPQGDLLVEGKAVAATPEQRKLLLQYRRQVIAVADAGMEIGSKGADLAGAAIGEAIGSIFNGDTAAMEKRVEAEAEKLKQEAKVICTKLPPMFATQQQLAASMPAFRPYADMTQEDVDDCMSDIDDEGVWSTK